VTFTDATGALKPGICTWQFNMKFDLEVSGDVVCVCCCVVSNVYVV
jgi:hypothetical protein